jgi:hypothetical protein
MNVSDRVGSDGEVVGKSVVIDVGNMGKSSKKGVESQDEKKGRKGATLLYPPLNVNESGGRPTETRRDAGVGKGPFHKPAKPGGKAQLIEDKVEPVVVDRVKSLGSVKEKQEPFLTPFYSLVKEGVNINDVVTALPTRQKAFLGGIDDL